jgi:hypothetical protein
MQEHGRLLLALDVIVVVEYDPRRVDDAQSTLGLNGLQFLRVAPAALQRHIPHRQKGMTNIPDSKKKPAMTHLGAFEGVDQAAFADIREADDEALRRFRLCTP